MGRAQSSSSASVGPTWRIVLAYLVYRSVTGCCLDGDSRRIRSGDLLFSGDNIYRDGCVGNIDAHHGSDLPSFIKSLTRIRDSDVQWLLPSHGPIFRKDNAMLQKTIDRLDQYQHMADFGTCAVDWPLLDEWDDELARGNMPSGDAGTA